MNRVLLENRNKDSSVYPGVLLWSWVVGFNADGFINC